MKQDQDVRSRHTTKLVGLVAIVLLVSLALAGCAQQGAPSYTDPAIGSVRATRTGVQAWSNDEHVVEYGVFYSKNRTDLVNVSPSATDTFQNEIISPWINIPSYLTYLRVPSYRAAAANATGTITVDLKGLAEGEKYYFRWYSINRLDSDGSLTYTLASVDSHVTLSHDATLKSISTSKGKLSPSFSKTTANYKVALTKSTGGAKITVASTRGASKIQMMVGNGSWSTTNNKTVSLNKGQSKTVFIKVTATDNVSVRNYAVKVSRAK